MKLPTLRALTAICVAVAAVSAAYAQEVTWPAWQLVLAAPGNPATVTWQIPADIDLESVTGVEVAGSAVSGFGVTFADRLLEVRLENPAPDRLLINEVTLIYPAATVSLAVTPTEVHWPSGAADGGLHLRSQLSSGTADHVLALLLENTASAPITLKDLHYAPAAVSTGAILLASGFEPLPHLFDIPLPFLDPASQTDGSLTGERSWDQDAWSGMPFDWFDFTEQDLTLESGQQAIIILGGPAFSGPGAFDRGSLLTFGPWFEYEQAEESYWFQPFVSRTGLVH